MKDQDLVAAAEADAPEILDTNALDAITGGVEYGGTNTCEPVIRSPHEKWIPILSFSVDSFEKVTDLKSK